MKKILGIFTGLWLAAFGIFALLGCGGEEKSDVIAESAFEPYKTGEEIRLKSVLGQEITLVRLERGFALKGSEDKTLMFDMFGTFCAPCQKEAPALMAYQLKNADKFMTIGLVSFDKATDEEVVENFVKKFNAYYFISNSKENSRIAGQILEDINYKRAMEIPFKVVIKGGVYQMLSDNLNERGGEMANYYLGGVTTEIIGKDIARINGESNLN